MCLIWSGHGYVVAVFTFASCLLMELSTRAVFNDDAYYQEHFWPMPMALACAGIVCAIAGRRLNREPSRTLVDTETGELFNASPPSHTFFFIRVQYWGPLLFVIALAAAIYQVANGRI